MLYIAHRFIVTPTNFAALGDLNAKGAAVAVAALSDQPDSPCHHPEPAYLPPLFPPEPQLTIDVPNLLLQRGLTRRRTRRLLLYTTL